MTESLIPSNLNGLAQKVNIMDRIDELREGALQSGFTIDFLEALTQGLSRQAFRRVIGNASSMPSYMKSSERPYLVRKASAPSSDKR